MWTRQSLFAGRVSRRHAIRAIAFAAALFDDEGPSRAQRALLNHPIRVTTAHRERLHARQAQANPHEEVPMSNDESIISEIRAALERNPGIRHPAEVAVSSREGTVTLRGSVGSPRQRQAAVKVARSVVGVDDVEDDLSVDLQDRWVDHELRGLALQALMSNDHVPADRIDATVTDGWLTLKGEVEHQSETDAAFDAVRGVPGIGGITNKIVVITAGIDG
jgi:osmotically-inducible protein OsmY